VTVDLVEFAAAVTALVDAAKRGNHVYSTSGEDAPGCRLCAAVARVEAVLGVVV